MKNKHTGLQKTNNDYICRLLLKTNKYFGHVGHLIVLNIIIAEKFQCG